MFLKSQEAAKRSFWDLIGGARWGGAGGARCFRCCTMVWMTSGTVTSAITRRVPPQFGHTEMSISKTRFSRCAQERGAVSGSGSGLDSWGFASDGVLHFLRAGFGDPGTMNFLNGELGAKTPWYRVRLAPGLGTKAASLAMKSASAVASPCVIAQCCGLLFCNKVVRCRRLTQKR